MDAFIEIRVQPLYGSFRAIITWKARDALAGGMFTVEKSHDGVNSWTPIGTVKADDNFIDENLISGGKLIEQFYRVQVVCGGQRGCSSTVGTFGTVTRDEFGVARQIMNLEYQAMRRFTKIHLFKLKVFGEPCTLCVDPDTGQAIGTSLCPSCFGTQKEGGFEAPVVTYMRIMTIGPIAQINSPEGTGSVDPNDQVARMLAFPMVRQNDVIVHKEADRRYLVDKAEVGYVCGKIPVIATVNLTLLTSSDIRYKLPV